MNFASDNVAGAASKVLSALLSANEGAANAYGADEMTARANALVSELFEKKAHVVWVATGTAANALALSALCPPWGAVLCHEEAHIAGDECGAPEFYTNGAKLSEIAGVSGKITPEGVEEAMRRFVVGAAKSVQPAAISISQASEAGTIYTVAEIGALSDAARARGLRMHLDGARLANALVTTGASPAEMTWRAGIDMVSLGLTKPGAFACEGIVVFDEALAETLAYRCKRGGHVLSKGRLLGAQACAMLEDGYWLELAGAANVAARRLELGLADIPGVRFAWPVEINEVFAILPRQIDEALRQAGYRYHPWASTSLPPGETIGAEERFVRLVTSFATKGTDIDDFISVARRASALPQSTP